MYLTRDAVLATLRQVAAIAPGSTLAMSFMLPLALLDPAERPAMEATMRHAAAAGTPFLSLLAPQEALALARESGFRDAQHVSPDDLNRRYFDGRADGLRTASEQLLVART